MWMGIGLGIGSPSLPNTSPMLVRSRLESAFKNPGPKERIWDPPKKYTGTMGVPVSMAVRINPLRPRSRISSRSFLTMNISAIPPTITATLPLPRSLARFWREAGAAPVHVMRCLYPGSMNTADAANAYTYRALRV